MREKTYRTAFVVALCLSALVMMLMSSGLGVVSAQSPTPTATPTCEPGYEWTSWGGCRPIPRPCPAGTVDINGNGNNDGGNDCQPLDTLARPTNCIRWPSGPYLTPEGYATCALPLSVGGQPLTVMGAVGCIDVTRTPYPRALVGLKTTFVVSGLFSSVQNIAVGQPGWYRLQAGSPWGTEGLYLHERYGNVSINSRGQPAFNTTALLAGDAYKYPSLNNVRAKLAFAIAPLDSSFYWTVRGLSDEATGGIASGPMEREFLFSSYPTDRPYPISNNGPDKSGQNTLPAFQVRLRATWDLYYQVEWDNYFVDGNNAYVRGSHEQYLIPLGRYYSYRVWDRQQSPDGVQSIYCNAAANGGYIPVPVIEAQSVVVK